MTPCNFPVGKILAKKYRVLRHIGAGWEGEVYLVQEIDTDIERAAKFFYPQKNKRNTALKFYAKKLHKLRHCPILIQYHAQDCVEVDDISIPFLLSEYIEGQPLSDFLQSQPGKRLHPYQALHLLYTLVSGVEAVHRLKEYHGDIHTENIIVKRYGLGFELKLIDVFRWGTYSKPENMQDDLYDMITVFHNVLGGKRHYAKQDDTVKYICSGLKKSVIRKKFRSATKLREHLENLEWV